MNIYIEFIISFVILISMLFWFIIGSKGRWFLKCLIFSACCIFSYTILNTVENLMGYPTTSEMPSKFQILWISVSEPSKKDGNDEGAIHVWLKEIDSDKNTPQHTSWKDNFSLPLSYNNIPRSYAVPYSKELHKQSQSILAKLSKGMPVYASANAIKTNMATVMQNGTPSNKKGKGGNSFSKMQKSIIFYEMPPPKMPEKESPHEEP